MIHGNIPNAGAALGSPEIGGDEIAPRAIAFAQSHGTALTPHVFEVWYTYAARDSKAINDELDRAMNTGQPISADYLTGLYHEHLSPRSMSDQLNSIGNDLSSALGNVTDAMDENLKQTSVFTGTLRSAKQSLSHGTSKREVSDVIKQLHQANQVHLTAAQRLSVQLEKNRSQVSKLKSELIEAKKASNTDYLTGLPNRRQLDEELDKAIFECRQKDRVMSVLMGAIDDLDAVAREHGISAGDNIMKQFAQLLQRDLRTDQLAARFAGAKFAVILPGAAQDASFRVAEEVRKRFRTLDWVSRESGKQIGTMSVSFGGTLLKDGDDRASVIDRADKFLMTAQKTGKDRTVFS